MRKCMRTDRKIRKNPHCQGSGRKAAGGLEEGGRTGDQSQVTKVLECHGEGRGW